MGGKWKLVEKNGLKEKHGGGKASKRLIWKGRLGSWLHKVSTLKIGILTDLVGS